MSGPERVDKTMSTQAQILSRVGGALYEARMTLESALRSPGAIPLHHADHFARLYRAIEQADSERRLLMILIDRPY